MAKQINIVSDTTYSSKAHGVHTSFLQHKRFCEENLGLKVSVNSWFTGAEIDHHHTLGLLYWLFMIIHPARQRVVHGHVVFDSLVGSIKLPGPIKSLARAYLRFAYSRADKIVAVSDAVKDDLIKNCDIVPGKIVVIKNLVLPVAKQDKLSKSDARTKLKLGDDKRIVVSVGQIQPRKRFDLFCELASKMSDIDFVWVGDTVFRKLGAGTDDMDQLKLNAPANVKLPGIVSYDKMPLYYQSADVFALLSDQENHPMAVLEAMNFNLPVFLREGVFSTDEFASCTLISSDRDLKSALLKLLGDKKLQSSLIKNAQNYLKNDILDEAATKYLKLYS